MHMQRRITRNDVEVAPGAEWREHPFEIRFDVIVRCVHAEPERCVGVVQMNGRELFTTDSTTYEEAGRLARDELRRRFEKALS